MFTEISSIATRRSLPVTTMTLDGQEPINLQELIFMASAMEARLKLLRKFQIKGRSRKNRCYSDRMRLDKCLFGYLTRLAPLWPLLSLVLFRVYAFHSAIFFVAVRRNIFFRPPWMVIKLTPRFVVRNLCFVSPATRWSVVKFNFGACFSSLRSYLIYCQ